MTNPRRILAIGDSLTAGYNRFGSAHDPYSQRLSELLKENQISAVIDQIGLDGDRVIGSMPRRLQKQIGEAESPVYDWIIILGGTNDLAYCSSGETIFEKGLRPMYEMVLQSNNQKTRLIVMTVIERAMIPPSNKHDQARQHLNNMIQDFCKNHPEKQRIFLVDLDKKIPYHNVEDERVRTILWDDPIHLTPIGYNRIAELIFPIIKQNLD